MAPKRFLKIGIIPFAILVLTLIAVLGTLLTRTPTDDPVTQLGGDFTLNSIDGPVSLQDFEGKAVVMMFGFTHCPDICPTGLATLAATLNLLPADQQAQTQGLFISVDPKRDTVERLDQYSRYFHPNILGITGNSDDVDTVVKQYGAFYRMVDMPDSALEYTVDHSSRVYIIDPEGKLADTQYHNSPPQALADSVASLLTD